MIAAAGAREAPTTLDDLRQAEEAFLGSTLREVMPVHAVEDIEFEAPGPVTRAAAEAVRGAHRRAGHRHLRLTPATPRTCASPR